MSEAELFTIDEKSGVPIWMQIRRRLIFLIVSGHFPRGSRLPSVREMSVNFGVNYNTINKVYQDLERDGYLFTRRGSGTYVSEDKEFVQSEHDDEVVALTGRLLDSAIERGMKIDDIVRLVRTQYEKRTPGA